MAFGRISSLNDLGAAKRGLLCTGQVCMHDLARIIRFGYGQEPDASKQNDDLFTLFRYFTPAQATVSDDFRPLSLVR